MNGLVEALEDPQASLAAIEKRWCEKSLLYFFKRAWREIPEVSQRPLLINWHHEVIIDHLEMMARRQGVRNLIENIPPRHSKSLINSVVFPAWIWCQPRHHGWLVGPHITFVCTSYNADLAEDMALKHLRLVQSEWYQSHWGDRVRILLDQQSRVNFGTSAGGARMSYSIKGGILGRGGDYRITDDPQSRRQADSELERKESLRGMTDLVTRFTDPGTCCQILVMQRLHVNDCTDWALRNWPRDTVHLMFPARYDPEYSCPEDIRTQPGELLWPEVWSEEELTKIELGLQGFDDDEEGLSSYAISGQLQQRPIPRGGGIIGYADWATFPESVPQPGDVRIMADGRVELLLPPVSFVILSLDTAMSEKETADWNACTVWGVWHRPRLIVSQTNPFAGRWAERMDMTEARERIIESGDQPRVILMEAWRRRCKLNDPALGRDGRPMGLVQRVVDTARRRRVDRIVIENKTRGLDVKNEIERQMRAEEFMIELFEPKRHGDKVARAHSVQPLFSQGLVYRPANLVISHDRYGRPQIDTQEFRWVDAVMSECAEMPRGKFDDLVDTVTMGLLYLRENGFLQLTAEFVEERLRAQAWQPRVEGVREHYGV